MKRTVHISARKHGVSEEDALHAVANGIHESYLDDGSPARRLILGFDIQGTLLELVVLRFDSGNEMVIHAMPARKQYLKLLSEQ
ncbi:toxin [Arthrobacter sp. UYEF13]|uniref:toxin n=1 Tax=unclassified Pseudarthrobacter TaxID=2647000 RepID=UPI00339A0CC2